MVQGGAAACIRRGIREFNIWMICKNVSPTGGTGSLLQMAVRLGFIENCKKLRN